MPTRWVLQIASYVPAEPVTNQVTTAPDNYRPSATHPDNEFTLTCGSQTECDTATESGCMVRKVYGSIP